MSKKKKKTKARKAANNEVSFSVSGKYLTRMVELTLQMEVGRCESLRKMSGTLLTGASILMVAFIAAAPLLFGFFVGLDSMHSASALLRMYVVAVSALVLSVFFAIASQLRYGYKALPGPKELQENIDDGDPFDDMESARHFTKTVDPVYESLSKRNTVMVVLLTLSACFLFVALLAALVAAVVLLPGAFEILG